MNDWTKSTDAVQKFLNKKKCFQFKLKKLKLNIV